MASSDMSLASEHVQRLLQCAVCLERFKQPKLLPCQHTFCLTPCLEGLVDRRTRSIRCPECRADHFVPRNGAASFPNNLTVIGFLELSGAGGRAIENICRDETRPSRMLLQPQRAASPQFVLQDAAGAESGGCYICHSEGRITRCCHCDQLVCESCRHAHMQQVRADVTRMIHQMRRGMPQLTEYVTAIGRKGTQLQNSSESVKLEISEALEIHVRELNARERALREEVETFLTGELRNLRIHKENTEGEIASLSSFCNTAESVLSISHPISDDDLVEMKSQCQEHLETVYGYEDGTIRPPTVKQIQASLESTFLSSTISNFGDLIITSRLTPTQSQVSLDVPFRRAEIPDRPREDPLVSLQSEYNNSRSGNALQTEMRSSSISPALPRRQLSPSTAVRASEVRFDDVEPPESIDMSRWGTLTNSSHPHRRSRYERRSDTEISRLLGGRGQSISTQMRDRTRHLSLGALPAANEYLEDESSESESDPSGQPITRRQEDRHELNREEALAATFPGARSNNFLPLSMHFSVSNSGPENSTSESITGSLSFSGGNNPSIYVNIPRNKYNQKGTAVLRFGQRGSGTLEFTWPRGVSVSPLEDKIYVSDSSNHRVQVIDNTGRFIRTFGKYGQGDGEFDCLAGITINGLGQVIIADRHNHRVQIFDRNGNFQNAFGSEGSSEGQLNYPWGVACDNMGFIYVCDKENHRIQVFQSNGTFVRMFGEFGNRTGQFENPHYIAVSPDNKVYVSDSSNHRVQVFSMYGDFLFSFGTCGVLRGQMKFPRGIAVDNQGFVVVADSGNNRIQIFRADGRFYSMFGSWGSENGFFKGLEGLAILANGNIVVSDRENHRIQIF